MFHHPSPPPGRSFDPNHPDFIDPDDLIDESTSPAGWRAPAEADPFAGMSDDDKFTAPEPAAIRPKADVFREPCHKCRGSKMFRSYSGRAVGPCYTCKGMGHLEFKRPAPEREKARVMARQRADVHAAQRIEDWAGRYPEEAAWIEANKDSFPFAKAMEDALRKYGSLTPNQTAAIHNSIATRKARELAKAKDNAALAARVQDVVSDKLEQAFARAHQALKWPKITLAKTTFKLAGPNSRNPGAIYVTQSGGETYLGKVVAGRFAPSRDCSREAQDEVVALMADPKRAAESYGRLTGNCCVCSRLLVDPESVARGIGPICADRFGW